MLKNAQKLIVAVVGMICATVLRVTDKLSETGAVGIISAAMFYIIGNGVAARKGKESTPILAPKRTPDVED
jgi:hypothetical protein